MNKDKNINKVIFKIALIAGFVVAAMLYGGSYWYKEIKNLYLMPLCYSISMPFVKKYYFNNRLGIAVAIIEVTKFARYIVLPLVYVLSDQLVGYIGIDLRYDYHERAVVLMCYEMLAVGLVMYLYYKYHYTTQKHLNTINVQIIDYKPKQIVYLFVVIWIILILFIGQYREQLLNFSISEKASVVDTEKISNNIINIIFQFGKIYMFGIMLYMASRMRNGSKKLLMVIIISLLYISSNWNESGLDISRWGLIVSSLLVLYTLISLFPNRKKSILAGGAVMLLALVAFSTYIKMTMVWDAGSMSVNEAAGSVFASEMFDVYFQGVYSVSNGISAVDTYSNKVGFYNFLTELFYHFPFAVRILGLENYTWAEYFFKLAIGDSSKICPSLIQSYFYFGPLGSPLFSCLSVFLALWFTDRMEKEKDFTIRLLYVYGIFWLSLFNCINFTVVEAHIWFVIFGIWICRLGNSSGRRKIINVDSQLKRVSV